MIVARDAMTEAGGFKSSWLRRTANPMLIAASVVIASNPMLNRPREDFSSRADTARIQAVSRNEPSAATMPEMRRITLVPEKKCPFGTLSVENECTSGRRMSTLPKMLRFPSQHRVRSREGGSFPFVTTKKGIENRDGSYFDLSA